MIRLPPITINTHARFEWTKIKALLILQRSQSALVATQVPEGECLKTTPSQLSRRLFFSYSLLKFRVTSGDLAKATTGPGILVKSENLSKLLQAEALLY